MKKKVLFIMFILFLSATVFAQGWQWQWTGQNTQKEASAWMKILNVDFQNNVYTGIQYGDSLFIGDTVLAHEAYYDWANWAVEKFDEKGALKQLIDINTTSDNFIFNVQIATDKDLNIYIAGEFTQEVYFLDTAVYDKYPGGHPMIFLAKITPASKVDWVRSIRSNNQDVCDGLAFSQDNHLYMVTGHYGNAGSIDTVDYFGQDTAIFETSFISLLKIDTSGNLIWRKEMNSDASGMEVRGINMDKDNNIILNGHVRDNLYYENDTLFHPHPGTHEFRPFIMEVNTSGELISGLITNWNMVLSELAKDDSNHFYLAGFVWDTLCFGSDTIIQNEDSTVNILAKLNSGYEPLWYATTEANTEEGSYYFYIDTSGDTLFFGGKCKNNFTLFDTLFSLGSRYQGLIGKVTPEGQLSAYNITHTQAGFTIYGMQLNNCNNKIYISGGFKGLAYFGEDTISSYSYSVKDGLVAELKMYDNSYNLGTDTTVCDSIRLFGPEGYAYYFWNDQPSDNNWLDVTESGTYILACASESGCWLRDTININIQQGFTIELGQDTVIGLNDTLFISVPDAYDSYLWSTGDTTHDVEIIGNNIGQGDWCVWVKVTTGVCVATDTLQLTVSSMNELHNMGVRIFPNPAGNMVQVFSQKKFEKIEIVNQSGTILIRKKYQNKTSGKVRINLSNLPGGIYFLKIYFDDSVGTGKIIKL